MKDWSLVPQLISVPAGPFLMRSQDDNPLAYDDEKPRHERQINYTYHIGRYPVTNGEFVHFWEAGGYDSKHFWTEAGWHVSSRLKDRLSPDRFHEAFANHPIGGSWYEATAFCTWLDQMSRDQGLLGEGEAVRLPTEAEWEKAVRGEHGREWPWGDDFDAAKANTSEQAPWGTTPVGQYSPAGDSPYGCADMSGNLWEWCVTKWQYNHQGYQNDNDPTGEALRLVRGGAYNDDRRKARCAWRSGSNQFGWVMGIGFRVVVAPSLPHGL